MWKNKYTKPGQVPDMMTDRKKLLKPGAIAVLLMLFCCLGVSSAEDSGADYNAAVALKNTGHFDEAHNIINKLDEGGKLNDTQRIALVDIVLEQAAAMKSLDNPAWKRKAKSVARDIKLLARANYNNPDYWLAYAKYVRLTENERHFANALKKALYYKPDFVDAYILYGDFYVDRALEAIQRPPESKGDMTTSRDDNDPHFKILAARANYDKALGFLTITDDQRAHACYRIAELEMHFRRDKDEATKYWGLSQTASPDSRWGTFSAARLK